MHDIFEVAESQVRSYCRSFPALFTKAVGHELITEDGRRFTDLLMGCGALNYGHNNPLMKNAVLDYLRDDGILQAMDLHTGAKREFLQRFKRVILDKRGMPHRVMFTGPTGTNAVEAALKLARKVTGRSTVLAFTGGFHGMTLGSLSATSNRDSRRASAHLLSNTLRLPYDGYLPDEDGLTFLERSLDDPSSGIEAPACILVETVQGEGGLRAASASWLRRLRSIATRCGALLIVDDIQAGCGRTGSFFSFEDFGIQPDLICLSKSISGLGLPMALLLIAPDFDIWQVGEHNGTFRGNNLAFVAAAASLQYWEDDSFRDDLADKITILDNRLRTMAERYPDHIDEVRGRGMMRGLVLRGADTANTVSRSLFARGIIAETCGAGDQVLKLLPALTIPTNALCAALDCIEVVIAQLPSRGRDIAAVRPAQERPQLTQMGAG
ncbi:diaminobutyrate--2-oxoglutarate transaminase [uncultured Nisaea sp.]|uniref:diaminobutyrate--2-oxoglutarate transaminase n=1 Tax=uncultured Nisaea sp. TaxID=538215 RepID=UPI0030EC0895|tara:strand:- start:953 stop:2269 length:1317 start_codon:yes stop_codon:yes gene_type:complete